MENDSVGVIKPNDLLNATDGIISGQLIHDGKKRRYEREYYHREVDDGVEISNNEDFEDSITLPKEVQLTLPQVAFFGMYAGDGSKGSESRSGDTVRMTLSFSQKNPVLSLFAVRSIKQIFGEVPTKFDIAVDSAYFLDKKEMLQDYREELLDRGVDESELEPDIDLDNFEAEMSAADRRYIENRGRGEAAIEDEDEAEEVLRWWYRNKPVMRYWLEEDKKEQLENYDIDLGPEDEIYGNTRRPFVKGARVPGQASRTDDTSFPTLSNFAEFFVHLVEGVEASIIDNQQVWIEEGVQWIEWNHEPVANPEHELDIESFIQDSQYCKYVTDGGDVRRHQIKDRGSNTLTINKPYGSRFTVPQSVELSLQIAFAAGLYFAEGDTPKEVIAGSREMGKYYEEPDATARMALGFNSSTNDPIKSVLRALEQLFPNFEEEVMSRWKLKIGSAYERETVAVGEKLGQTFSRRGTKGQGKSRSLALGHALLPWTLSVLPCLEDYSEYFSHIEPTGAGIPRVDLSFAGSPNVYLISIFYCLLLEPEHLGTFLGSSESGQSTVGEFKGGE